MRSKCLSNAILYKPSFAVCVLHSDDHGRLLVAEISCLDTDSAKFQLIIIYGPNQKAWGTEFFDSLSHLVDSSLNTIFCGDFNTTVNPELDRRGCNPTSCWAYNWPCSAAYFLNQFDLIDAWCHFDLHARAYTWNRPCGSQASRLDMFWIMSHLLDYTQQIEILPFFRSDHSYVYIRLYLPSMPHRGPGVWKLNTSLLLTSTSALITDFWQEWQEEKHSFPSPSLWWDAGKTRIKLLSRPFSRRYAQTRRSRLQSLRNTLLHLQRCLDASEDVSHLVPKTKRDLELAQQYIANVSRIRAREQ